ncbi:MAG: hypothetical protein LBC75_14070 [Fibromonadaceae bacterium]|jgi:uncharacterized protein (TIGR02145 family)|nr:hypothetical protein [Fibromonadaceae bacterium]
MVLRFFLLAIAFLFSCTSVERDNCLDSGGINYMVGCKLSSSSVETLGCSNVGSYSCPLSGYKTQKIATETWMWENLDCDVEGGKCYDDNLANCERYGRLYDWCTAMALCSNGWHLPSNDEWQRLVDFVGGDKLAGLHLKSDEGWNGSGNGDNIYGFAALPSGVGYSDGGFANIGNNGYWWSSSEPDASNAYYRYMDYIYEPKSVHYSYGTKDRLYSVRCIKDD